MAESHDTSRNLLQRVTTTQSTDTTGTQVAGSAVTGNTVLIQAGRDVTLAGSQAVADTGLIIDE